MTTKQKPVDIHFFNSGINIKDVYDQIEATKDKTLEYRNKNRKDEEINPNFKKTPNAAKLDTRQEEVEVERLDDRHYKTRNKNHRHYKDQFIKQKNSFRSMDVLFDPDDVINNQASISGEAGDH